MKKDHLFVLLLLIMGLLFSCMSDIKTKYDFSYNEGIETSGAKSWIFEGKFKPPIFLSDNEMFLNSVNSVLDSIGLPNVSKIVLEKEKMTGFRSHRGIFEWTDYELGQLEIIRSTCNDANYQSYDCIWKVLLKKE